MSSIANFSGLASGVQWRDLVDQIGTLEASRRITPITQRINANRAQQTGWQTFRDRLSQLEKAADALRDGTGVGKLTTQVGTTPSGRELLTATSAGAAQPASHNIRVVALASAEKIRSGAIDSTQPLGLTGDFTLRGQTVALTADTTLAGLRDQINSLNQGADATGVTASIVGSGTEAHLVLTSDTTGVQGLDIADGAGSVLQSLGILNGDGSATNQVAAGADAQIVVDGITITRSSNRITDAIEGVTLDLRATSGEADEETVALTVARDDDAALTAIKDFVQAFNDTLGYTRQQREAKGALGANGALRTTTARIRGELQDGVGGLSAENPLTHLSLAGVSFDRHGMLQVDEAKVRETLSGSFEHASELFGALGAEMTELVKPIADTVDGEIKSHVDALDQANKRLETRRIAAEDSIERMQARMIEQFTRMEEAMATMQAQMGWLDATISAMTPSNSNR